MESKPSYGFIVGRFQVPQLHDGHLELINLVRSMHKRVVIFLGVAPFKFTQSNPLDFITRKRMIEGRFPDVTCLPIYDTASDEVWSQELDKQISLVAGGVEVTLYGGRDSFVPYYHGKHKPVELKLRGEYSGTQERAKINSEVLDDPAFRQGIIYATHNRYPLVLSTVDVAVRDGISLLLINKSGEKGWRFPGGIVELEDTSLETRATREVLEETGVAINNLRYIGSHKIYDPRFKQDTDGVMTALFDAQYHFGSLVAGDDANTAVRVPRNQLTRGSFVEEHKVLYDMFLKYMGDNGWTI